MKVAATAGNKKTEEEAAEAVGGLLLVCNEAAGHGEVEHVFRVIYVCLVKDCCVM